MDNIWRQILCSVIENPKEKQRIARAIGVESPRTLDRWARGTSTPRNHQIIRALKKTISRSDMDEALLSAFPDVFKPNAKTVVSAGNTGEMFLELYRRVLRAYTIIQPNLRQWTIKNLIFMHLVRQLDPSNVGLALIFAQVEKRETYCLVVQEDGSGTGIWDARQLAAPCTLPLDSFLGSRIITGLPSFVQSFSQEHTLLQLRLILPERIGSLAICPVTRAGAVAGGILCCTTQQDFFTSLHKEILEEHVYLLGLAFTDQEFVNIQAVT